MFIYASLGQWDWDVEWLGTDLGDDKDPIILANIGYEWDLESGHPWLAFAIGKVGGDVFDATAFGARGGFKFEVGENLFIGPRVDLLVIDTEESGEILGLQARAENTGLFGFGVDIQYRFDLPGL